MGSSDQLNESQKTALLISIGESITHLQTEFEIKSELHTQTASTLISLRECMSSIKIDLTTLKSEQKGFILARKDRTLNCDRIHSDHEQRLRDKPSGLRCAGNEIRLKTVEKKVDSFLPIIYKLIGGVIVIAIVIPPVITIILGFLVKQIGKGGG